MHDQPKTVLRLLFPFSSVALTTQLALVILSQVCFYWNWLSHSHLVEECVWFIPHTLIYITTLEVAKSFNFAPFVRSLSYFLPWQHSILVQCLFEKQINLALTWQTLIPILSQLLLFLPREIRAQLFSFLTLTLIKNASIVQKLFLVCCRAYHDLFWLSRLILLHPPPLSKPNLTSSCSRSPPTSTELLLFTLSSSFTTIYLISHLHDHSKLANPGLHLYFKLLALHQILIWRQVFPLVLHSLLEEHYS